MAYLPPFGGFGGGASRSREAAGEGRRNHQRGTGQISAKTGESVATRPRRRTRRLQCDVSGATLTEIEGPGTSSGAYGRGGGGGGREGGTGRGTRGKEVSPPVTGRGDGRGAVTLPTRPPPGIATIFFYRLGSILFPPSPSAAFFPVANTLGGGASRSREAAGEGRRNHQRGTGQISAKTGESVATRPRRRTRRLQSTMAGDAGGPDRPAQSRLVPQTERPSSGRSGLTDGPARAVTSSAAQLFGTRAGLGSAEHECATPNSVEPYNWGVAAGRARDSTASKPRVAQLL